MRQDKPYIGGEETELYPLEKDLIIEVILFILIGVGCITFFLTHPYFPERWFAMGKLKAILSLLIILILSPFGAHLMAKGCTHLVFRKR